MAEAKPSKIRVLKPDDMKVKPEELGSGSGLGQGLIGMGKGLRVQDVRPKATGPIIPQSNKEESGN